MLWGLGRVLTILGKVWVCIAVGLITLGYLSIIYFQGWWAFTEVIDGSNYWNFISVVITLLPGMGLMFLGSKLSGEKPPWSESRDPLDDHYEVVGKFGVTLEQVKPEAVRDVSELPYSKEVIASALQHLIKQPGNVGLEALKVGYLSLADFQPLTAKERDVLSVMGNLNQSSPDQAIDCMNRDGETYLALLAKCSSERKQLDAKLRLMLSERAVVETLPTTMDH